MPINSSLVAFKNSIRDIARPNRFTVHLSNPWRGVRDYPIYAERYGETLTYYAYTASIPQFDIEGPSFKYRGTHATLAGDFKREPVTIAFWNDIEWKARSFFEDWVRSYVNYDETNSRRRISDYRLGTTLRIKQWAGDNKLIAEYIYNDACPFKIEAIELDQSNSNAIETFKVDFHYGTWDRVNTESVFNPANISTELDKTRRISNQDRFDIAGERPEAVPLRANEFTGGPVDTLTGEER